MYLCIVDSWSRRNPITYNLNFSYVNQQGKRHNDHHDGSKEARLYLDFMQRRIAKPNVNDLRRLSVRSPFLQGDSRKTIFRYLLESYIRLQEDEARSLLPY